MRILLTGGTGLIGKEIGQLLVAHGHEVLVVSRRSGSQQDLPFPCKIVVGDLTKTSIVIDQSIDGCIHLLGESVAAKRWSESQKNKILKSRTLSSQNLLESLKPHKSSLKTIVSASAIGIYGDRKEETLIESSALGNHFLSQVCKRWEEPFLNLQDFPNTKSAVIRIGVVLARSGGALQKMLPIFKANLGAPLGSGKQWMSWVDIEDIARLFVWVLESEAQGVYNGTAPQPVSNKEFSSTLARVLNKFCLPAVPSIFLKLLLGEMSTIVLASQRVYPERALKEGFMFKHIQLEESLKRHLL